MTLSGNLGFVPLDEVLRLLTRAGNDGMVQITNSSASGRIFVAGKGISLATTLADLGLKTHLASSGYISDADLEAVEDGSRNIGEYFPEGSEGLGLLREITIESIYQLNAADADFQVVKDETSPFASPVSFDLESVLADSRDRSEQWAAVKKTIDDLEATLSLNRELDKDSVELTKDSWRLLAAIGSEASVTELAKSLGTTEFAVAKVAAQMVKDGLVSIAKSETLSYSSEATTYQPSYSQPEYTSDEVDEGLQETPANAADVAESVHDKSWWDEPETEKAGPEETFAAGDAEDEDEPVMAQVSVDEAASGAEASDEDTEAFLEKVFSDLGDEAESVEDGHGLMRRRRMGSILRELGED